MLAEWSCQHAIASRSTFKQLALTKGQSLSTSVNQTSIVYIRW